MIPRGAGRGALLLFALSGAPRAAAGQNPDTAAVTLRPVTVTVTRDSSPLARVPASVSVVTRDEIGRARTGWGLDEALAQVPGVLAQDRYNFSLDERISIRGFGARSAFAVRGVKILIDGIPQTLPDGQGQLTNFELAATDRVQVLRGSASALYGNASGGVVSITTFGPPPRRAAGELRVTGGYSDVRPGRSWSKWVADLSSRVGGGAAAFTASRLVYDGERDHSSADLRNLAFRLGLPLDSAWSLAVTASAGDDPRADNPGALTLAELSANRDTVPRANDSTGAGKAVTQEQAGVTLTRRFGDGGAAALTVFGVIRDLANPQTFAFIDLHRHAGGVRLSGSHPLVAAGLAQRVSAGFDLQTQRDNRFNWGNVGGTRDTTRRLLDQLEHVTEFGPFVEDAVNLTPRANVTLGARYDRVHFQVADRLITPTNPDDSGDRTMGAASGSLGAAYALTRALTAHASVGTSFETPTTTELTNRPDSAGGFNPDLGPQTAVTYEVGLRHDGARVTASVSVYQADVTGELISFGVPSSQRRFFRNAGRSRHRGVEAELRAGLAPGIALRGAWTYSDFRYLRFSLGGVDLAGHQLPGIPPANVDLVLRLAPPAARGAWLELEQAHASSYLVSDTLATRTSAWWRTDLRAGWDGAVGGVIWHPFIGVNNCFDHRYEASVVIDDASGRFYEPAPGRNIYFGLAAGAGH